MSFWFFQYNEAIYVNDCLILGRFLLIGEAVYLVIQKIPLSQLYRTHTSCLKCIYICIYIYIYIYKIKAI